MIEIRNLTKTFGETKAVDNLSLTINPGIVGLVGHNGAGKSTLFRLLSDVLTPDAGEIFIEGKPHNLPETKARVFFLSDDPYCGLTDNYKDVYRFYANFYPIDFEKYTGLLDTLHLPKKGRVGNYSKGMKRQLFLALSLSVEADVYLLDEAFDGIDPLALDLIKGEIIKLGESGKTVILSSHNIASLERLVDRFILLYKGKLSKEGTDEDMGESLVKYQGVFQQEVKEEDFAKLGFRIASFKKVGSIYHVVFAISDKEEPDIQESLKPILWEKVAIDPDEVIALQMRLAEKEAEHE